jgi:hypothetical protein
MSTQRDPTDLRGQERDAETEEVGARARREREVNDLKWLMAHPQGRRIVARLLDQAGVSRTSFSHSGSVMAFNEGRRDMGLFIQAEVLEAAPEGYFKLLKEYQGKDD